MGYAKKSYGGICLNEHAKPLIIREHELTNEKGLLCREAAKLINDHETIFIAGSSTTYHLSKFLPEKIAVHWGFDGNPDGLMSPKSIFLILPLILLAIHWMCLLIEATINKYSVQLRSYAIKPRIIYRANTHAVQQSKVSKFKIKYKDCIIKTECFSENI